MAAHVILLNTARIHQSIQTPLISNVGVRGSSTVNPLMNDTKWNEVRLAMYALGELHPQWRVRNLDSGYLSTWDGEWFYHFREGGYGKIEWVEIKITSPKQDAAVLGALKLIHVPGHRTEHGFRVYGYSNDGVALEYI